MTSRRCMMVSGFSSRNSNRPEGQIESPAVEPAPHRSIPATVKESMIDETHDPRRQSWVESANGHRDFPIQNLPFVIFSVRDRTPRGGVLIGDEIVDFRQACAAGLLSGDAADAAEAACGSLLNPLFAL